MYKIKFLDTHDTIMFNVSDDESILDAIEKQLYIADALEPFCPNWRDTLINGEQTLFFNTKGSYEVYWFLKNGEEIITVKELRFPVTSV